jgi:hypothetical protein
MLSALLLLLAEAPAADAPAAEPPVTAETATDEDCKDAARPDADTRTITVCAQRPNGYRLNPDVMAAKRLKRGGRGAAPRPGETFKQDDCATVGPMGCRGQGVIDIPTAAIAAVQMVAKAAKGENVGKMFQTDKQLGEYELYLLAKAEREAREAEAAADKVRAEALAKGKVGAKDQAVTPASVGAESAPKE